MKPFWKVVFGGCLGTLLAIIVLNLIFFGVIGSAISSLSSKGNQQPVIPRNAILKIDGSSLIAERTKESFSFDMLSASPSMANTVSILDAIRALEIALYEESHPVTRTAFLPKRTKFIGISVSRDERNARIDRRLRERLDAGMVDEVRRLLDSGLRPEDLLYYGLEYKYLTLYLTGRLTYDEMVLQLQTAIHQFAKRQMTWFRGMERKGIEIEWITLS